jgi:hypothetical protein
MVSLGMVMFMACLYVASIAALIELIYALIFSKIYIYSGWKLWLLLEGIFIVSLEAKYRLFTVYSSGHLPTSEDRFYAALREFRSDRFIPTEFFRGWFFGSELDEISIEELREWIGKSIIDFSCNVFS